jgi:hypothetical protein
VANDGGERKRNGRWRAWPAVVLCIGLGASACGGSSDTADGGGQNPSAADSADSDPISEEGPPVDGGKLVYGVYAETDGWNPHETSGRHRAAWSGPRCSSPSPRSTPT